MFYKPFFRNLAQPKVDAHIRSEEPHIEDYNIKDIEVPEEKVIAEYEDFPIRPTSAESIDEDGSDSYLRFKEAYNKVGTPKMFNFFSLLAKKESGYNSEIQNLQGAPAYGYFQFMQDGKRWNNIRDYAGVDIDTFRRSPEIQIQAAHKLAKAFLDGFSDKDRARARELGYSDSALLAGAWLGGVGGVRKFLHEGKNVNDKHWSKDKDIGVDMKSRMDEFNNMFKSGGVIKKHQWGNKIDDPDHYYDYSMGSKEGDHWYSRNPDTGLELKNPNHPTAWMGHEYDESHGYKRYVDKYTGRYYTFKDDVEKNMKGLLLNLEEVGYPKYGEGRNSMKESIDSNFDRIKWIYNEMVGRGLSKEQAAAVLGNMWKESRIAYNADNNGAYGLVQLTGQRKDAYKEYLDKYSLDDNTVNQVNYLIPLIIGDDDNPHNLSNAYRYNGDVLDSYNRDWMEWSKDDRMNFLKGKDLHKLSDMFCDYFEKPKDHEADKETRYAAAKYIYNKINNGE